MLFGKGNLHILPFLVVLWTMMSCSEGADVITDREQVQIRFTITVAGSMTGSRATWGDNIDDDDTNDYESDAGTYYENTIYADKFQVLAFDMNNNYVDQLGDINCVRRSDDNGIYDVSGSLSVSSDCVEGGRLSCKLVVLANFDDAVEAGSETKLTDIGTDSFDYSNHTTADIATGKAGIPMFGIATLNDLRMTAGIATDAGIVYMLSAMAKIRVNLDLDSNNDGSITTEEEGAITSVTLTECNESGYIMPKGYAAVANTTELRMVELWQFNDWTDDNTFNPYTSAAGKTLTFQKESDTEYYLYVPEYEVDDVLPVFNIKFDFQLDDDAAYTFNFDLYEDGVAKGDENYKYNIERNHIYIFTIKKNKNELTVESNDWTNTFDNEYVFE